ncbi:MAG: alpha/beta hydrolase [Bacteroidales bacterium]|nr:alpha/beta hydrolase [Bacteroidales bacterium]
MKKSIAIAATIALVFVSYTVQAQWWTGTSAKTGLVLCLHLGDSSLTLYSPLQSSAPIPASSWQVDDESLNLECKAIGLKMNLKKVGDNLAGTWRQGLLREEITFYPSDTLFTLEHPQTPLPPYSFDEEEITADYTDSQGNPVHLSGTLTYPKSGGRFPTVVLVSGSGQQNRDEEIMQHRPFLVLANYLASRGIATLRYDDRGVDSSTGNLDSADTYLFAEDAEAMLMALKGNRHIDTNRLGIGGHSEGGAIAPMVAARNRAAKFVVMLAGQGCTGSDVMVQQNEAIFIAKGVSADLVSIRVAMMKEIFGLEKNAPLAQYKAIVDRYTKELSDKQRDSIGIAKGTAYQLHKQLNSSWMSSFLKLDPGTYLPRVACPILALCGSKDSQVLAEPNLAAIKKLNANAMCRKLDGLNHLFQRCTTGSPDEYMLIEETFNEEAMQVVADFILRL